MSVSSPASSPSRTRPRIGATGGGASSATVASASRGGTPAPERRTIWSTTSGNCRTNSATWRAWSKRRAYHAAPAPARAAAGSGPPAGGDLQEPHREPAPRGPREPGPDRGGKRPPGFEERDTGPRCGSGGRRSRCGSRPGGRCSPRSRLPPPRPGPRAGRPRAGAAAGAPRRGRAARRAPRRPRRRARARPRPRRRGRERRGSTFRLPDPGVGLAGRRGGARAGSPRPPRSIQDGCRPEVSKTCSPSTGRRRHISSVVTMSFSIPTTLVTLVTHRCPERRRASCTTRSMLPAIWRRRAGSGMSPLPDISMFSRRTRASRGLFACRVDIEPGWPVFIAWSISFASGPRISPTMMRSGRMRRVLTRRSRIVTCPVPSALIVRVSRRMTWGCWSWSSAASSMVMRRSPSGISRDRAFMNVVLPAPVPPAMRMLSRARTAIRKSSRIAGESTWRSAISSSPVPRITKRRIEIAAPSRARGGMMTLTRDPSGRRASSIGLDSSTRRPIQPAIRWATCRRCCASRKRISIGSRRPRRST